MNPLVVIAGLAAFAVVMGSFASWKLGRMSRKKENTQPNAFQAQADFTKAVLSNLDEQKRYSILLGQRVTPPQEESDPAWKQMPPRDEHGRFLKKPVS